LHFADSAAAHLPDDGFLAAPAETPPDAVLTVTQVVLGAGLATDPLYALLGQDLADAVGATGGPIPPVVDDSTPLVAGAVLVGGPAINARTRRLLVAPEPSEEPSHSNLVEPPPTPVSAAAMRAADSYQLSTHAAAEGPVVVVAGASPRADAYGVYHLVRAI